MGRWRCFLEPTNTENAPKGDGQRRRSHRGGRKHGAPVAEQPVPKTVPAAGGEEVRRKRTHRGGRRHHGAKPKTEG